MLESLVATILNRFLGNYVSNLNYDQLNIGVWKGEANLRDLKLRREALDKLDLPIDVLEGYLGELTLSIPWSNLKTKPVKVFIENVYLLAVPKSEATLSLEEEEERAQQLKQRRLATAELLSQQRPEKQKDGKDQQTSEESDGFLSQLTTKVIDNLQVSIKNIHLRFEDNVSDPGHPFAAGITLKELSAVSTDGQWNPTFISEMTNTIHKLATLHSLSVYWNTDAKSLAGLPHEEASRIYTDLIPDGSNDPKEHQYILKPVSGTGKVKLNKQFGGDTAKTDITLLFDELGVCLDDHQYRDALLLVDLFHINLKKQKYLKFHPEYSADKKFNPRAYWKFATSAVLSEIHERNYQWTWDHFRTRRDQRRAYIECYVASKTKKATQEQEDKLAELERTLSFDDIRFYRSLAKNKLKREKIKIEQEKKKNESENKGWFSSWWYGGSSSDKSSPEGEDEPLVMTEDQKRELYDAIDYDEEKAAIAAAVDMPKDTIKFKINTELKRGSLTLMQYSHTAKRQDLTSLVFDTVTVGVTQYIESSQIAVGLRDLRLYDGITPNTLYPQLIGIRKGDQIRSIDNTTQNDESDTQEPLLYAVLDHKPFNNIADNAIKLKSRRLEIIFNPAIVRGVLGFFKPPENKSESINALLEAAGESLEGFKQQTLTGLEYALNQHTTLAVDMDMDAPLIIIPESCTRKHTPCMIIDAGHIRIDSDLANHELANEYKGKKISKEDYQRLQSLMYDKFHVQLTQTKLLIGKDVQACLKQQQQDEVGQDYVIQRIDMTFIVELCILQRASQFTKFKISGHLPLLSVNISDAKYKVLMRMIDLILGSISSGDDQSAQIETPPISSNQQRKQSLFLGQTSWNSKDDLLISDAESESSSSPSWRSQSQQSVDTNTTTLATPSSATGSFAVMSNHYQHEDFRFTFTVDKVSATVHEASDEGDDKLLCELILETFYLDFVSRPYDMVVNVSLKTLNVVDDMEHGEEFHYLVTSNAVGGTRQQTGNLVNVKYIQAKRSHPLYQEIYQGFDQTVEIGLSTLNIIVTRSSLLTLYNFILTTFTGPSDTEQQQQQSSSRRLSQGSTNKTSAAQASANASNSSNTIKVDIHMDSLTLILNDDGKRLGTGVLSYGDLKVLLYPNTLKVEGKFGNFTLTDDSAVGPTNEHNGASEVYMLSIKGDELADFSYETYDPAAAEYPGYESQFYLRMGALQFKLLDSTKPILDYLSEFLEMKTVYDAARQAAAQQIQQQQETNSRMHFDVAIKSPVVIFPMSDKGDMILAHLGEIRAANEFTQVTRRKHTDMTSAPRDISVSRIRCGLYDISLRSYSTSTTSSDGGTQLRELSLPIIDDLDIAFLIESPEAPAPEWGPATRITGTVSDIRMALTERQYKWLLDIYNNLMETFMSGGGNEEETNDIQDDRLSFHSSSVRSQPRPQQKEKERAAPKSTNAIQLAMTMSLNMVRLELLAGSDADPKEWDQHRIAELAFNNTSMSMQTMEDASMLLEVQMRSITFIDTRATSSSKFRQIMTPSHVDGPQFQVQLRMPAKHEQQIMSVSATVDSPKVVLSLDYVFLLVDFFMKPFSPEPTTEAQAFAKSQRERYTNGNDDSSKGRKQSIASSAVNPSQRSIKSQKLQQQQPETNPMQLHYNVNIVDVELACLANPESHSSEAVILSFKQLTAVQQESLVCKLDSIGMVLCRMDSPKGSAIPFIQNFDVDLKWETSSNMPGCSITMLQVDVQPLIVRISYQDAMLVMDIVNKALALMGSNSAPPPGAQGFDDSSANNNNGALPIAGSDDQSRQQEQEDNTMENQWGSSNTNQLQKIEPYIVMSKESLKARFEGLQFTLIEDLHELPFIDASLQPFTVNASDWSSALSADMFFTFAASSFNFRNSHWEPVIEPWGFGIKATQDPATKAMSVKIESKESLNLDITHNFLETLLTVSDTMVQAQTPLPENAQKHMRPYLIRNCTGYDLQFWNMSDDAGVSDIGSNKHFLKDGEEMPWTFRDWKRRRERRHPGQNLLGVHVEAFNWKSVQHVSLDKEGVHTYRMKDEIDGIRHRLVVDIKLKNHVKQVTFRSGLLVVNQTLQPMQLALTNATKSKRASDIWYIEPGSEFAVPIAQTYNSWLVARPNDRYEWSSPALHWTDITHPKGPKLIACKPLERDDNVFYFQVQGVFDKLNSIARAYPNMTVQLGAPIEVKNELPFDFNYTIEDKTEGNLFSGKVPKGEVGYVHHINSDHHVALSIHVQDTVYAPSDFLDIKLDTAEDGTVSQQIRLGNDENNPPLYLLMHVARLRKTSDALWINICAPYLVLNKTGFPVAIRSRMSYRQSKHPTYTIDAFDGSTEVTPFMFSFPEMDRRNRVQISVNESKMSEPLSFEAVGSVQDIVLQSTQSSQQVHIGVHVQEGTGIYHMSKLVTIAPRFILKNNLGVDVRYREFASDEEAKTIVTGDKQSLFHLSKSSVRWLSLRLDQEGGIWSAPFDLQQIGDNYIKLEHPRRQETIPLLVRVSIVMQEATIFVFLETEKAWPYGIVNLSSVPVSFSQEAIGMEEYKLSNRQKKAIPSPRVFELQPGERMAYSWCMPVAHEKRLKLNIYGKTSSVNFQAIGTQVPIRYKKQQQAQIGQSIGPGIMSLDIVAVDSALQLRLTDFDSNISPFRPKSSATSTAASSSREGSLRDTFEAVSINHIVNFALELNLANIGISIINKRVQEMAYATIRDVRFKYTDSNQYQSIRTSIQWLQIDNQFHGSIYPILFYPTTLPKNSVDDQTPTFHLALDLVKDDAHGVYNFKLFSLLLQEMTFEMDEDFLYCLLEFTQFASTQHNQDIADATLFKKEIPEPECQQVPALYYFQEFCIQPMRLNLSFMRTEHLNAAEASEETGRSPFRYAFDVFTMTIGNVNDAPIKLNALIVENLRVSSSDLMQRITLHYRDEVIFQVHKVLGSVDFLGNPVGLFSTLSSGFGELFYEPYQGFIMSDRPQDLGIGIARGVGGFMKKSVFGVTDSVSRITGSIGKGLSVATMDKKFQDRRRINHNRNKPRHAVYGITQGATYFGSSIASGVAGLVKRPIEGAEEGGVIGFAGGIGRGLVGAVTKPLVGVFDLASNVTAGVRETTTVFDANDIGRERLPRYVAMDNILRPFSQRESLGQMWLKDLASGKYYHDIYMAHCATDRDENMVLLTYERLLVINTRKLDVELEVRLDNINECASKSEGLVVVLKDGREPAVIGISETTSCQWLVEQIESTMERRREEKERR